MDENVALKLHSSLLQENRNNGFDIFNHDNETDKLLRESLRRVEYNEALKKAAGGPSARRERFSSKYWRAWNSELGLLEDLSKRDVGKPTKKKRPPKLLRNLPKDAKACSFSGPVDPRAHLADSSKPQTSVEDLIRYKTGVKPSAAYIAEVPDSFKAIKGGGLAESIRSFNASVPATVNCEFKPIDKLHSIQAHQFPSATRFPKDFDLKINIANEPPPHTYIPPDTDGLRNPGPKFLRGTKQFGPSEKQILDQAPGPGTYKVTRMFEEKSFPQGRDIAELALKAQQEDPGLMGKSSYELAKLAGFAYGCNRQEHILYGRCLDGLCARRTNHEESMLKMNDYDRTRGAIDYLTREAMVYVPGCRKELSALHVAVHRADLDAIEKLKFIGHEVNSRQEGTHYAPLHVAVLKCQLPAAIKLIEVFADVIDLDPQDSNGNTPLHHASRMGLVDTVSMLCEAGCNPTACENHSGKYPLDVVRTHEIYQIIRLAIERMRLQDTIQETHTQRQQQAKAHRHEKRQAQQQEQQQQQRLSQMVSAVGGTGNRAGEAATAYGGAEAGWSLSPLRLQPVEHGAPGNPSPSPSSSFSSPLSAVASSSSSSAPGSGSNSPAPPSKQHTPLRKSLQRYSSDEDIPRGLQHQHHHQSIAASALNSTLTHSTKSQQQQQQQQQNQSSQVHSATGAGTVAVVGASTTNSPLLLQSSKSAESQAYLASLPLRRTSRADRFLNSKVAVSKVIVTKKSKTLKNPHNHSFLIGYWQDDEEGTGASTATSATTSAAGSLGTTGNGGDDGEEGVV